MPSTETQRSIRTGTFDSVCERRQPIRGCRIGHVVRDHGAKTEPPAASGELTVIRRRKPAYIAEQSTPGWPPPTRKRRTPLGSGAVMSRSSPCHVDIPSTAGTPSPDWRSARACRAVYSRRTAFLLQSFQPTFTYPSGDPLAPKTWRTGLRYGPVQPLNATTTGPLPSSCAKCTVSRSSLSCSEVAPSPAPTSIRVCIRGWATPERSPLPISRRARRLRPGRRPLYEVNAEAMAAREPSDTTKLRSPAPGKAMNCSLH